MMAALQVAGQSLQFWAASKCRQKLCHDVQSCICPSLQLAGGMGQCVIINGHGREDWGRSHQPLPCQMEMITCSKGDFKASWRVSSA